MTHSRRNHVNAREEMELDIQAYIDGKKAEVQKEAWRMFSSETELTAHQVLDIVTEQTIKETILMILDDIEERGVDHIQTLREQVSEK